MTVSLIHAFVSAIADGADATLVRPSNWNAEHTLSLAADRVLGRLTTAGAVQELTAAQLQTLIGASLEGLTIGKVLALPTALP